MSLVATNRFQQSAELSVRVTNSRSDLAASVASFQATLAQSDQACRPSVADAGNLPRV